MSTAVPATEKVKIPPFPSTEFTVNVISFVVVTPPKFAPSKTKVSFCANPEPIPVTTAEYVVPVLVTLNAAFIPDWAVVYAGEVYVTTCGGALPPEVIVWISPLPPTAVTLMFK